MSTSKWLILATLVLGAVVADSACTQKAADDTTNATGAVLDETKQGSDTALEASKKGVDKTLDAMKGSAATVIDKTREAGDRTKEIAGETADKAEQIGVAVGSKTREIVSTTGEAMTDGWITTKVNAKFVDETLLKGSDINVDTENHVVTLKGTVGSDAAKARAAAIARSIEGVTSVVNLLVVKHN